jgi:hypothetical protein
MYAGRLVVKAEPSHSSAATRRDDFGAELPSCAHPAVIPAFVIEEVRILLQ